VLLASEPHGGDNSFAATVRSRYFLGFYCEYLLDAAGVTLRAQTGTAQVFPPGQRVYAQIAARDCKVIREG
jgi:hypothetical protein